MQHNEQDNRQERLTGTSQSSRSPRGRWVDKPLDDADRPPLDDQSTQQLVKQLAPATLRHLVAAIPSRVRRRLIDFFAIIALVAPLVLLFAPSTAIWFAILGFVLFSIAMLYCLVVFGPEEFY